MRYRVLTVIALLRPLTSAVARKRGNEPGRVGQDDRRNRGPQEAAAGASGNAVIHLNAAKGTVCWQFKNLKGVTSPNASHIHKGGKGVSGPVFVPLGAKSRAEGLHRPRRRARSPRSSRSPARTT